MSRDYTTSRTKNSLVQPENNRARPKPIGIPQRERTVVFNTLHSTVRKIWPESDLLESDTEEPMGSGRVNMAATVVESSLEATSSDKKAVNASPQHYGKLDSPSMRWTEALDQQLRTSLHEGQANEWIASQMNIGTEIVETWKPGLQARSPATLRPDAQDAALSPFISGGYASNEKHFGAEFTPQLNLTRHKNSNHIGKEQPPRKTAAPIYWTEARLRRLAYLVEESTPNKTIAEEMGTTATNIACQKWRRGLKNPVKVWTEADDKKLADLAEKGMSNVAIAKEFKTTCKTIRSQKYELGRKIKLESRLRTKWTKSEEKRLAHLIQQNASSEVIAERMELELSRVRNKMSNDRQREARLASQRTRETSGREAQHLSQGQDATRNSATPTRPSTQWYSFHDSVYNPTELSYLPTGPSLNPFMDVIVDETYLDEMGTSCGNRQGLLHMQLPQIDRGICGPRSPLAVFNFDDMGTEARNFGLNELLFASELEDYERTEDRERRCSRHPPKLAAASLADENIETCAVSNTAFSEAS
ncbi:hypothetical protein K4F52_004129 [Lecanicillium sp. MT-2017a]|nr:hypothetical protein K4F52_004129 [Lecanicillium sp. MT-2017a]